MPRPDGPASPLLPFQTIPTEKRLPDLMPPRAILRFLLILWATIGAVFVLDRFVIFFLSNTVLSMDSWRGVMLAFAVGSLRDMALAALLVAPALLAFILLRPLWRSRPGRLVAIFAATAMIGLALFGGVAEIFFWNEFDSRFNGVAVNYLMFPREVIGNIQQSFDTAIYLPMIAIAALAIVFAMRRPLSGSLDAVPTASRRSALAAVMVAAGSAVVALLPGIVSADREVNQIGASGVATFVEAAITNNTDYDGVYPGMPEDEAIRLARAFYAGDHLLDPPGTRSIRRFVDNGTRPKKLNIVIVIEESFGSVFVDSLDNRRDETISPNLDRLAGDGMFFTNIYASGDRTVRGLEAVLTSFQPIPGISTARLPSVLKDFGYRTAMLYAGLDSFDNMGNFWRGIGFDEVWDQTDIADSGFTTIWGHADEYLFGDALKKLDRMTASGKPAMLTLLTVSNHRPYTYPTGRIDKDPEDKRIENTATYADWAFGDFIERARARPWFDDTVFVFLGDHGWKVNGAAKVPLHSFRIPILVYAPAHIAPRRVDTLGAQIDLAPTLLGLLGISYESRFFGKDLLRTRPGEERIAVAHNYSIAFAQPGNAVVLEPDGSIKAYAFTPGKPTLPPLAQPDDSVARLGIALTQVAQHMFYAGELKVEPVTHPKTVLALPPR